MTKKSVLDTIEEGNTVFYGVYKNGEIIDVKEGIAEKITSVSIFLKEEGQKEKRICNVKGCRGCPLIVLSVSGGECHDLWE